MHRYVCGFLALLASQAFADTPPKNSSTPAAYPPIASRHGKSNQAGADLSADYLYWTAREDGLEFAYDGVSSGTTDATPGSIYNPKNQWQSGYRVGLAAYTAYDGWDLYALYTWYKLSTMNHVTGRSDIKRTWQIQPYSNWSLGANVSNASTNWSLDFNVADLLLRRKFNLSPKFVVQPEIGFKFSWQKQTYIVTYDSNSYSGTMKIVQKSEAAGLEAACYSAWYFLKPVALVGRLGISTLWFDSRPHRVDTMENTSTSEIHTSLNTQEKISYAAPVIETFLGLSFESSLYKNRIKAIFQAGYEFQIWFDANQFARTILDANGSLGNLNLQGLTLRGQIEF